MEKKNARGEMKSERSSFMLRQYSYEINRQKINHDKKNTLPNFYHQHGQLKQDFYLPISIVTRKSVY